MDGYNVGWIEEDQDALHAMLEQKAQSMPNVDQEKRLRMEMVKQKKTQRSLIATARATPYSDA